MDRLIVQDVRCFKEYREIPLHPITLLVGENSTGKSTFLALVRAARKLLGGIAAPDFNEPPFELGSYEQIAHFHGGQAKRAKEFKIGFTVGKGAATGGKRPTKSVTRVDIADLRIIGTFVQQSAQPALVELDCSVRTNRIVWRKQGVAAPTTSVTVGGRTIETQMPEGLDSFTKLFAQAGAPVSIISLFSLGVWTIQQAQQNTADKETLTREFKGIIEELAEVSQRAGPEPRAIAPIRSRPKRTYDPVRDLPTPEGGHVPMVLANLRTGGGVDWQQLMDKLSRLGIESGLFGKVDIKRKGDKGSDPFQVVVAVDKLPFNLVDVGYGVSQVLPILVDCVLAPEGSVFLLQQPEVHLHPRAQAALGSFLAALSKSDKKRFVVETHSDYLIDRIRMETRPGKSLAPSDVGILYFERSGPHVDVSSITLGENGDLASVPDGYRSFFLTERRRLITGEG